MVETGIARNDAGHPGYARDLRRNVLVTDDCYVDSATQNAQDLDGSRECDMLKLMWRFSPRKWLWIHPLWLYSNRSLTNLKGESEPEIDDNI